jgi:hypothetical protein
VTAAELGAALAILGLLAASVAVVVLVALLAGDLRSLVRDVAALWNGKGKA